MGGRGAASSMPTYGKQNRVYGTEFHTILQVENIKFVEYDLSKNSKAPLETRSASENRVYVVVDKNDNTLKSIVFYDKFGKRVRQIDLDHEHLNEKPHIHSGYDEPHDRVNRVPQTNRDKAYIKKVTEIWREFLNGK